MPRTFTEEGRWSREAETASHSVRKQIDALFDSLESQGFNPREAASLLEVEIYTQSVMRIGRQRRQEG